MGRSCCIPIWLCLKPFLSQLSSADRLVSQIWASHPHVFHFPLWQMVSLANASSFLELETCPRDWTACRNQHMGVYLCCALLLPISLFSQLAFAWEPALHFLAAYGPVLSSSWWALFPALRILRCIAKDWTTWQWLPCFNHWQGCVI